MEMLTRYIILFILPAVAYCSINIRIKANINQAKNDVRIDYMGKDIAVISDQERKTFKLSDATLKDASVSVFGKRCKDIYVKEPTPWNVYQKYGWDQVKRTFKPIRAKLLSVQSEPVTLATHTYENHYNTTVKYGGGLTQLVEETIHSNWSKNGELSIGQKINYNINLASTSGGNTTTISYASIWGKAMTKKIKVTLGSSSDVDIEVPPGHGAVAKLIATRGSMEIEIEYEATIAGQVFCNYNPSYKSHYWYAAYLSKFQRFGKFSTSVRSFEVISFSFYTDYKTEVSKLYNI